MTNAKGTDQGIFRHRVLPLTQDKFMLCFTYIPDNMTGYKSISMEPRAVYGEVIYFHQKASA